MGSHTGPSPVDRGRAGSKHHLITDGHGTPLAVLLTGSGEGLTPTAPGVRVEPGAVGVGAVPVLGLFAQSDEGGGQRLMVVEDGLVEGGCEFAG